LERRFRVLGGSKRPTTDGGILASQHFGDYEMRKTQIALAAVALVASSAALAQVSVYGNADGSLVTGGGATVFNGGGGYTTSLLGFRGTEDLGGGLKASFNLETATNLTAGGRGGGSGANTNLFNRAANVSLGNEMVGVTMGNQISIVVVGALTGATAGAGDNVNIPAVTRVLANAASVEQVMDGSTTAGTSAFFIPQAVTLRASAGGLTFQAQTRAAQKDTNNSSYTAFTLGGSFEGFNVSLGQQQAAGTGTGLNYKTTYIAANTSLGGVGLNGAWANGTGDNSGSTYMFGASYPLTEAFSVGGMYSKGIATAGSATSVNLKYSLSKSTVAYVTTSMFDTATTNYGNTNELGVSTKNVTAVGISHSF